MAADLQTSQPTICRRRRQPVNLAYSQQLRDSALHTLRCLPYRLFSYRRRKSASRLGFIKDGNMGGNRRRWSQPAKSVEVIDLTDETDDDRIQVSLSTESSSAINEKEVAIKQRLRKHREQVREEEISNLIEQMSLRKNVEDELDEIQARIAQLMIEKPLVSRNKTLIEAGLKSKLKSLGDLDLFDEILSMPNSYVHINKFNQIITTEILTCLRDGQWLNDEVINFQISLMQERNSKTNKPPNIFFHNSFFFTKLMANGTYKYSNVSRWTKRKKVDIFACDLVIFPVHVHGNHWCLGVIDFAKKELVYYDSLGGRNSDFFTNCRRYIQDEHEDKKQQALDLSGWQDILPKDIPRQNNGCDCGVFALKYADYISEGLPLSFSQKNMPYFRRRILLEIVNGALY